MHVALTLLLLSLTLCLVLRNVFNHRSLMLYHSTAGLCYLLHARIKAHSQRQPTPLESQQREPQQAAEQHQLQQASQLQLQWQSYFSNVASVTLCVFQCLRVATRRELEEPLAAVLAAVAYPVLVVLALATFLPAWTWRHAAPPRPRPSASPPPPLTTEPLISEHPLVWPPSALARRPLPLPGPLDAKASACAEPRRRISLIALEAAVSLSAPRHYIRIGEGEQKALYCCALAVGIVVSHLVERNQRLQILSVRRLRADALARARHSADAPQSCVMERAFRHQNVSAKLLAARIGSDELHKTETLGAGAFGEVRAALWRGQLVAVKRMHRHRITDRDVEEAKRSAEVQLSLEAHPNIALLRGVAWSVSSADFSLVMELCCAGQTLLCLLSSDRPLRLLEHKLPIALGLARGVGFLHSQATPVLHRDLKPDNILVAVDEDDTVRLKITDFGLSREASAEDTLTGGVGTPLFTAPEVLRGSRYDFAADVWSFGCILVCADSRQSTPYTAGPSASGLVTHIVNADDAAKPSLPRGALMADLVDECCALDRLERCSMREAEAKLVALDGEARRLTPAMRVQ